MEKTVGTGPLSLFSSPKIFEFRRLPGSRTEISRADQKLRSSENQPHDLYARYLNLKSHSINPFVRKLNRHVLLRLGSNYQLTTTHRVLGANESTTTCTRISFSDEVSIELLWAHILFAGFGTLLCEHESSGIHRSGCPVSRHSRHQTLFMYAVVALSLGPDPPFGPKRFERSNQWISKQKQWCVFELYSRFPSRGTKHRWDNGPRVL